MTGHNPTRHLPTVDEALAAYKAAWREHLHGSLNGGTRKDYVAAFEALQAARKREDRPWSPGDYK